MNYIIIKKCEPDFFRDFSVYYGIKIQYSIYHGKNIFRVFLYYIWNKTHY